jgi:hypothetical protein
MSSVWNRLVRHAAAGSIAAAILCGAAAQASDPKPEVKGKYTAQTGPELWSMSSVLELYRLSGWRVIDVRRIWANKDWPNGDPQTRHNAFTDLARFKDHWYCVFRVGADHGVTGPLGGLRVIRSKDGVKWTSVFFYQPAEHSVDVRDSKLLVTDDGRLVVLGHESYRFEPARSIFKDRGVRRSMTWLSTDGEHWSGPHASKGGDNTWIWGAAWHKGAGYGVAYSEPEGRNPNGGIYRTKDGTEWELVADNIFPKDDKGVSHGNEASVVFDADDSAWMYVRDVPYVSGTMANVGFAKPPYKEWDWTRKVRSSPNLCGPKMLRLSDGRIVAAGRIWGREGGSGYGDSHTSLHELDLKDNTFCKIADLPSQGDNGYPGIVEKDGELWISYYSCHEDPNPEGRKPHEQRACIYLARVKIGGPRYHYADKYSLSPLPPYQKEPEPARANEALPPKVSIEQYPTVFHVDLAPYVNRSLADEVADDGAGGWSDQGPNCDMRGVQTGMRKFGGVPFRVLPEKSVVALKSMNRKPGTLPDKVEISVGRTTDALFFLHSAAYFGGNFRYVLHYADGKDVTLTMDARNLSDWAAEPIARFPEEQGTFTTVAETVPTPMFGRGSLYRTEWSAPADRRAVNLKSIEFASDGKVVPLLVAITGVSQ